MYHNSKLSKFAFRTKTGLKWPFFAQTIPFFVLCFITNIYIWYIVGSGISRSERLQYFQIHKRYVTFLIMLFVYFSCQGRSFMLTALWHPEIKSNLMCKARSAKFLDLTFPKGKKSHWWCRENLTWTQKSDFFGLFLQKSDPFWHFWPKKSDYLTLVRLIWPHYLYCVSIFISRH